MVHPECRPSRAIARSGRTVLPCTNVAAPKIMGLSEVAQRLGISKSYARELSRQKGFPDGTRLTAGTFWSAADVEAWIARNRPADAR